MAISTRHGGQSLGHHVVLLGEGAKRSPASDSFKDERKYIFQDFWRERVGRTFSLVSWQPEQWALWISPGDWKLSWSTASASSPSQTQSY